MIANDKPRPCGLGMSRESEFLSLVLRQKPEEIGLQLDKHGWVRVDDLPRKLKKANRKLSRGELFQLVESSDKKRFTLSEDGLRIRAAQGHSIHVDLG
ncbi:RNA 2'-phosphotransferase [uncultured Tateyamaria sp.]|uniref:RNA 2'-phosphotransferase n=1 Tax=uncultured Tateyamaria sp. TaxID=455651 RepID=UPI002631BCCC|nr:RNA 2'-phosphotransferase [uncultured Tateyamaria sp.]